MGLKDVVAFVFAIAVILKLGILDASDYTLLLFIVLFTAAYSTLTFIESFAKPYLKALLKAFGKRARKNE